MKIPKKVKIGGMMYDIIYPYEFIETSECHGRINFSTGKIMISNCDSSGSKNTEEHNEYVLLHEIIHAIDKVYCGFSLGDEQEKELITDCLALGLQQFLRDNFEPLIPL